MQRLKEKKSGIKSGKKSGKKLDPTLAEINHTKKIFVSDESTETLFQNNPDRQTSPSQTFTK